MEYRKLIKFGSNSFVLSLPKRWIKEHDLKKGEPITIETVGDDLVINPIKKKTIEENVTTIEVKPTATGRTLKRELLSAYEHNATTINFTGKAVSQHTETITNLIDSLTGLEIVEHTKNKILAKTYIKTEDISVEVFLKRVDNSIKSMILEISEELNTAKTPSTEKLKREISQREKNVDKIVRLLQRVMRERLHKQITENKKEDILTLLRYWQITTMLETISDNLEKLTNDLTTIKTESEREDIRKTLLDAKSCFEKVMNAFYNNNRTQAYQTSDIIRDMKQEMQKKHEEKNYAYLLSKLEENMNVISEINKLTY